MITNSAIAAPAEPSTNLRERLIAIAIQVGAEERAITEASPFEATALNAYFQRALAQTLKSTTARSPENAAPSSSQRLIGFLALALYLLNPDDRSPNELRTMCLRNQITPEQGAIVFSLLREFMAWQPATDNDLRLIVTSDRSIIRSSRVAGESADPELFLSWLEENKASLTDAETRLHQAQTLLGTLADEALSQDQLISGRKQFTALVRTTLRDIGLKHGRAGLAEIRQRLGVSRARPEETKPAISFSEDVVLLAGHYAKLSLSERRALRVLMQRLDIADDKKKEVAP